LGLVPAPIGFPKQLLVAFSVRHVSPQCLDLSIIAPTIVTADRRALLRGIAQWTGRAEGSDAADIARGGRGGCGAGRRERWGGVLLFQLFAGPDDPSIARD